jgi:molybdopterin molybdotransferase
MPQSMSSPAKFPPLRSLDDALAQLLAHAQSVQGSEAVSTFDADRRVLAQDVVSQLDVPGFDNSAMDGYAVRSADVREAGTQLRVAQRIPAGHFGQMLHAGEAARIFTGAPLPPGADAVVMQEDCSDLGNDMVRINAVPTAAQWVRRAGDDIKKNATVLLKGELLTPASLGLAASIGLKTVPVLRRPRVALFSTGDELVMPGEVAPQAMPPGAIYNSNRFFLRALLLRLGCEVTDLGIVPDDRAATVAALQTAAENHDLILTSGGVSVGEEDHIKPAVQQLGTLDLWSIAIKPGKPFAYGKIKTTVRPELVEGLTQASTSSARTESGIQTNQSCHFIGLPGNPVSSFITFLLLVRPFLQKLQGQPPIAIHSVAACAHFNWSKADKRQEFLRVKRNAAGGLDLFANQSSGVLTSAVWADGVVDNPAGQTIKHGDSVRFIPFSELL